MSEFEQFGPEPWNKPDWYEENEIRDSSKLLAAGVEAIQALESLGFPDDHYQYDERFTQVRMALGEPVRAYVLDPGYHATIWPYYWDIDAREWRPAIPQKRGRLAELFHRLDSRIDGGGYGVAPPGSTHPFNAER